MMMGWGALLNTSSIFESEIDRLYLDVKAGGYIPLFSYIRRVDLRLGRMEYVSWINTIFPPR